MPHRLVNNQKKAFHKGYLCRTANYFSQNDLNCVMSALLIEQMPSEDTVRELQTIIFERRHVKCD